jgi:solute carrier family 25 aspartate/glutamate transporter 12/13
MPAAYLTTPAGLCLSPYMKGSNTTHHLDVIKTRLQVEARSGQTHYKGLTDAFVKICK